MTEIYSKSWKRLDIDLNLYDYSDTGMFFVILDHEYTGTQPSPDYDNSILYSGLTPDGMIKAINEVLVQKMSIYNLHQPQWSGWTELAARFYLYWTTNDWTEFDNAQDWNDNKCICVKIDYDWTYEDGLYDPYLSEVYNNILDYRQFLTITAAHIEPGVDTRFEIHIDDTTHSVPILDTDFSHTYNLFLPEYAPYDGTDKTITIGVRPIDSEDTLTKTLTMTATCYRYVIYYLNKRGGWEWFFVNGKELKRDKMTRLTYKRNYFSQVPVDSNKVNYSNTINESWEFTTGWLEEGQASHVIDLLESNKVYIQDLSANDNVQKPVIVTNSSVEYKNYKNQGRKLYSYTINVDASQPRYIIDPYKNIEFTIE